MFLPPHVALLAKTFGHPGSNTFVAEEAREKSSDGFLQWFLMVKVVSGYIYMNVPLNFFDQGLDRISFSTLDAVGQTNLLALFPFYSFSCNTL